MFLVCHAFLSVPCILVVNCFALLCVMFSSAFVAFPCVCCVQCGYCSYRFLIFALLLWHCGSSVVGDSLLIVTLIMVFCICSLFCCALLFVHSSFAIILMGKRELVALLFMSSWYHVIVVWLLLTVRQVCLQFVNVVFPDNTHLHVMFLVCILPIFNMIS